MLDRLSYENDLKAFSFTFLELPKFKKSLDCLGGMIDMWAYFFKHAEETTESDLLKLIEPDHIIQRAYEELNRFHWNDEELLIYDQAEKYEGVQRAILAQKFDEGKAEGKAEGKIEEKMLIAKNMLKMGINEEVVKMATGLSIELIQALSE